MNSWQLGIYYKTPPVVQSALISTARLLRRPIELGRSFRRYREQFESSQWWCRGELENWQLKRFQVLLRHAYKHVPAYRNLYDRAGIGPADIRSLKDIERLPTITKADVRRDPSSFVAVNARSFHPVQLSTSGTTGSPFQFLSDRQTESIEWAFFWRHKSWGGAGLFAPMISLGGKVVVPLKQWRPPYWRYNWAEGILWLSTFHLSAEVMDLYIDKVKRSGVRFLRGYPSNLYIFAQHLRTRNVRLPMTAVFSESEPLFGYVRDLVEDQYDCRVFDWYGVSERVVTSSLCDQHAGYHVHMENCLVEILDADCPAPLSTAGEVVATCLSNYAMPLIRYRTGDRSAFQTSRCDCGRSLATLKQVQTKCEDVLTTADGRYVSPFVLTHPFKPIKGIEKSQIVQEEPGVIVVSIVANTSFDSGQKRLLTAGLLERLGEGTSLRL